MAIEILIQISWNGEKAGKIAANDFRVALGYDKGDSFLSDIVRKWNEYNKSSGGHAEIIVN